MKYTSEQTNIIRETVEAIKSSPGFINSPQLQNFLTFIVEKTLAGEAADIKGYTIGVDALGRSEDFDPTTDPSVRVMAGRLRQSLSNYFLERENEALVKVILDKGSYIPVFKFPAVQAAVSEVEVTSRKIHTIKQTNKRWFSNFAIVIFAIAIVILLLDIGFHVIRKPPSYTGSVDLPVAATIPIEQTSLPSIAINVEFDPAGIPEWISANELSLRTLIAFSRFKEYRIFDVSDGDTKSTSEYLTPDYTLDVFYTKTDNANELEAFLKLFRPTTGKIVWSGEYMFPKPIGEQEEINRQVVEKTVTELMSPYGVIYRDLAASKTVPTRLRCIAQIYSYFMRESLQTFSDGLRCAQNLIDTGTASSSMYALLSFLYSEAYRRDYRTTTDKPLETAELLADRAIELDPLNARAFQARFAVEKIGGKLENDSVVLALKNTIELNPVDRDIAGDVAAYFVAMNELEIAEAYLDRALSLTPVPPAWLNFYNYLFLDLTNRFAEADIFADKLDPEQSTLVAFALLLSADRRNLQNEKQKLLSMLLDTDPELLNNTESVLIRRGFAPELARRLAQRASNISTSPRETSG